MDGNSLMIQDLELGSYVSLYFHLPFCSKKCPYCHFYVIKTKKQSQSAFFDSLKKEWEIKLAYLEKKTIYSIYFGGGTPSQVSLDLIEDFLSLIFSSNLNFDPNIEITFEANPEDLSYEYLGSLRQLKINRLSIGVQSFNDEMLKTLERQHHSKKAQAAILNAFKIGFENISIDLMYDLPSQTEKDWCETLAITKQLPITHLSLYNLTIEPQTVFYKKRKLLEPSLPSESKSLHLLNLALISLEEMGLSRYEISAFCKKGFHSKHNVGYWLGREFHGYGPAAFSYFEKKRFKNISDVNKYSTLISKNQIPIDFEEKLEEEAHLRELLVIRLRLKEGIEINKHIHFLPLSVKNEIESLSQKGLLKEEKNRLFLTEKGFLFYDSVAEALI